MAPAHRGAEQPVGRSEAITHGKIADILQARGQLDEALASYWRALEVHEGMKDPHSVAYIRFRMGMLVLTNEGLAGDPAKGREAVENVGAAFAIAEQLGHADFVTMIAPVWAQILAAGGEVAGARRVLGLARDAHMTMGFPNRAAEVEAKIAALS